MFQRRAHWHADCSIEGIIDCELPMDKMQMRAEARAFIRASQGAVPSLEERPARTSREQQARMRASDDEHVTHARTPPPLDKARARRACLPMGTLLSIAITVDARKRRRTWYIVDPDPAVSAQYAAAGLDLTPGCKVLVDAEAMRPVALVDFDPAVSAEDCAPMPHGFNPYYDLPAG